jgi:arylsulfatase A-like enzyme
MWPWFHKFLFPFQNSIPDPIRNFFPQLFIFLGLALVPPGCEPLQLGSQREGIGPGSLMDPASLHENHIHFERSFRKSGMAPIASSIPEAKTESKELSPMLRREEKETNSKSQLPKLTNGSDQFKIDSFSILYRIPDPWNRTSLPLFIEYGLKEGVEKMDRVLILQPGEEIRYFLPRAINHNLEWEKKEGLGKISILCPDLKAREIVTQERFSSVHLQCIGKNSELRVSNPSSNKNDLILSKLFLHPMAMPTEGLRKNQELPDIVFIVIDSLRADALHKYSVSPNLDEFQRNSLSLKNHWVNAAWTRPSTMVFFTGQYASKTILNFWDYPVSDDERNQFYQSDIELLPRILSKIGYETIFIGNNPFVSERRMIGSDVGFHKHWEYSKSEPDTEKITQKTLDVLTRISKTKQTIPQTQPRFFFINYNDPHKPYTPPTKFQEQLSIPDRIKSDLDPRAIDYLGEVAFVDSELGKLFQSLKEKNLWDNSLILITSDHGEVMDPGHEISLFTGTNTLFGHGQGLYGEDIHVPLFIKFPNSSSEAKFHGTSIHSLTQSIDIFPTIRESIEAGFSKNRNRSSHNTNTRYTNPGIPIQSQILGQSNPNPRLYYGETRGAQAASDGRWKVIKKSYLFHRLGFWTGNVGKEIHYVFDLKSDPRELRPILLETIMPESPEYIPIQRLKEKIELESEPNSYYVIKMIGDPERKRTVDVSLGVSAGAVRPVPNCEYIFGKGSRAKIQLEPKQIYESCFQIYPDVSFPKFDFLVDQKPISSIDWGAGSFDLSPVGCIGEQCQELFVLRSGTPALAKKFRIQVWRTGGSLQKVNSRAELGAEAMDILKRQGYIQ